MEAKHSSSYSSLHFEVHNNTLHKSNCHRSKEQMSQYHVGNDLLVERLQKCVILTS